VVAFSACKMRMTRI